MTELNKLAVKAARKQRINTLKKKLADTDYLVVKHFEGLISDEEYAKIAAERQSWRDEINTLEEQLEK